MEMECRRAICGIATRRLHRVKFLNFKKQHKYNKNKIKDAALEDFSAILIK